MADYPNTPVMSQIQLPSGNTYYIKDGDARTAIDELEQRIAGGMGFKIVWTQTDWASSTAPTTAKLATIPKDVVVHYNSGAKTATGTLAASASTLGNFYLTYSNTQVGSKDYYNEYATISEGSTYTWEKIGDTQVDLTGVVTNVTTATTDSVIGSNATFTVTQPDISLTAGGTESLDAVIIADGVSSVTQPTVSLAAGEASGAGKTEFIEGLETKWLHATATGGGAAWNSKDQKTVLTGVKVTTQPTVTLTANLTSTTGDGRLKYVEDVTGGSTSPTKVHLSATASDGAVSASGDSVTALTGLGTPSKSNAVSGVSTSKLVTTTVTGVSGSTTPSVIQGRTSQTTADGSVTTSTTNTDILKSATVNNETLILGACTLDTQTTYSANAPGTITVPTAASSATTVATGSLSGTGGGGTVATGSSGTISAITAITPTTDTVLGTASTFTVTNPTITISTEGTTGPEVVGDVSDITVSPTYKYMSAAASGTAIGSNGTATVIGSSSTFTNTQPTIAVTIDGTSDTNSAEVVTGGTTKYMGADATGGNVTLSTKYLTADAANGTVAWNNKDTKTPIHSLTVTKGTNSGE